MRFDVEILREPEDRQFLELEKEFLSEIGEGYLTVEKQQRLAQAAQTWCRENEIASLTVCCAPCDEAMYQSLGFKVCLGNTFAYLNE